MTINSLTDLKKRPGVFWVLLVLVSLMISEVLLFKKTSDFFYVILLILWYWANKYFKIDAGITVFVGICFLLICPFFMLFNEFLAMKAGIWAFILLLCGSISMILHEKEVSF